MHAPRAGVLVTFLEREPQEVVDRVGEALAFVRRAPPKLPRDIVFVTDLPRTALGKVQHFLLKQLDAQARAQGEAS